MRRACDDIGAGKTRVRCLLYAACATKCSCSRLSQCLRDYPSPNNLASKGLSVSVTNDKFLSFSLVGATKKEIYSKREGSHAIK